MISYWVSYVQPKNIGSEPSWLVTWDNAHAMRNRLEFKYHSDAIIWIREQLALGKK